MSFQTAVERLSRVFESLQGALRGPARSPWSFSKTMGRETSSSLQSAFWQNPGFGQGFNKKVVADAVRQATLVGGDPMQLLGQSVDKNARQMQLAILGTRSDYWGGLNTASGKLIRRGMETRGEGDAYLASALQTRMGAGIGDAALGSNVAFRLWRAAGKSGNTPVSVSREAVESMQSAHGRLSNYLQSPGSRFLNKDDVLEAEAALNRIERVMTDVASSGKSFGKEMRETKFDFEKIEEIQRRGFFAANKKVGAGSGAEPSAWFRAVGWTKLMGKQAGEGLMGYFRRQGSNFRGGYLDWRAMHALSGGALGALSAAGGPAFATLSGSAGLAAGALGQSFIRPATWASRKLQGLAQSFSSLSPAAQDAIGYGVGGAAVTGAGLVAGSRLITAGNTIVGAAETAAATRVGSAALATGAVSLPAIAGVALGTMKPEGSRVPVHAPALNPFMPKSMIRDILNVGQRAGEPDQDPQAEAERRRKLAVAWGSLATPFSTSSLEDAYAHVQARALVDPLTAEKQKQDFESMLIFLKEISGSSARAAEALDRMNVGNR